jgi:methylenetetrahydrofolate dehydrogenase (NADP+)/methenyltetrahydrofolate cyclohydrolase
MDDSSQEPILLDGKKTSREIEKEITEEVGNIVKSGGRPPHLAAILVGEDGASKTYVASKVKACNRVGFTETLKVYDNTVSQAELESKIDAFNQDDQIDGYIVQLPLPPHISVEEITDKIDPNKDVDGFTPANFGKMDIPDPSLLPATPKGIMELLRRYDIETEGKHCVVVGNSHIVGSPMSILLSGAGKATVTVCHIHTKDLAFYTRMADILVVAVGKPKLITEDMVKKGVAIIDVGITRVEDSNAKRGYILAGDVDFDMVAPKCSYITPVPGGVGPMTIASLMMNTIEAYKRNHG